MKVKINYSIKNLLDNYIESNELIGILNDNRIVYNDSTKTTVTLDDISITRENDDYVIKLLFINKMHTKGTYYLKKHNKYLDIDINTKSVDTLNGLKIEYELCIDGELTGKFIYILNYEKM